MKLPRFISFVYVVIDRNRPLTAKVGKANVPRQRLAGIVESIRKETGNNPDLQTFFFFPTFRPFAIESAIHRLIMYPSDKRAKGSGRTEWFRYLNVYAFLLTYCTLAFFGFPSDYLYLFCGAALVFPRPLDFAFLILFLGLIEWGVVAGCLYGFYCLFC